MVLRVCGRSVTDRSARTFDPMPVGKGDGNDVALHPRERLPRTDKVESVAGTCLASCDRRARIITYGHRIRPGYGSPAFTPVMALGTAEPLFLRHYGASDPRTTAPLPQERGGWPDLP